jgi:DNA-binding beta-propeller fold protein YncE
MYRNAMTLLRLLSIAVLAAVSASAPSAEREAAGRHLLYVAEPGIRNYVEYGGVGVLVFDMDNAFKFVRRIPSQDVPPGKEPENVKGIAANAATGRLYVTTFRRVIAYDLSTDHQLWNKEFDGGCDRLALSPDGKILYVPSFEGAHWNVLNADTGDVVAKVVPNSGAHNTIYGPDGKQVFLAGLKSPILGIADPSTHKLIGGVGPFSNVVRPFTINGAQTLCFVNVNDLLGFEVGDITSGKMLHRVEVTGYQKGKVKRHGCPSHGIGLTPDERELWLADGANSAIHVFDARAMPPKQIATIKLRDQPGWITFSLDGQLAFPSTGEVVDTATRKTVATLTDESGRAVQSEKVVEVVFAEGKVVETGDQFGVGRVTTRSTALVRGR